MNLSDLLNEMHRISEGSMGKRKLLRGAKKEFPKSVGLKNPTSKLKTLHSRIKYKRDSENSRFSDRMDKVFKRSKD